MANTKYDLKGQQFGDLIVLEQVKGKGWLCKCSCGKKIIADGFYLRKGRITSCGDNIHRLGRGAKNVIGKKFNSLLVLDIAYRKNNKIYYKCKCDCGNETIISANKLGITKSCGCENTKNRIVGKHYNNWTVKEFVKQENNKRYYKCKCDCGNESIENINSIKKGLKKSCPVCKKKRIQENNVNKYKKHIGERFGELTIKDVIWDNGTKYIAICSCGKEIKLTPNLIKNRKHCGDEIHRQKQFIDDSGKKFRMLTCLGYDHTEGKKAYFKYKCDCGNEVILHSGLVRHGDITNCGCLNKHTSTSELEIFEFVKTIYKGNVLNRDKSLGVELDVYIPEKKVAIELNGLIWHSSRFRENSRIHLLSKTRICNNQDIRLIHFWDYEWIQKQDICKSIISSALGVYETKLMARKCKVDVVKDKELVARFFQYNHIQGSVQTYEKAVGLYYNNELVQCALFGKQHFGKNDDYELYRMATKLNTQIVGGFSKILKHCGYNELVSYVSIDKFNAKGYFSTGWEICHTTRPTLFYTDGHILISRHEYKKQRCVKLWNEDSSLTEKEMCAKHNLYQIWDCGKIKVKKIG